MVDIRRSDIDEIRPSIPIATDGGSPTPYFIRLWESMRQTIDGSLRQIQQTETDQQNEIVNTRARLPDILWVATAADLFSYLEGDEYVLPPKLVWPVGMVDLADKALRLSTGTVLYAAGKGGFICSNATSMVRAASTVTTDIIVSEITLESTSGPLFALDGPSDTGVLIARCYLTAADLGTVTGYSSQRVLDCSLTVDRGFIFDGSTDRLLVFGNEVRSIIGTEYGLRLAATYDAQKIQIDSNFFNMDPPIDLATLDSVTDATLLGQPLDVAFGQDDVAFASSTQTSDYLVSIDTSDPSNIAILDSLSGGSTINGIRGVGTAGSTVFATAFNADSLVSVDASDPSNLSIISSLTAGGTTLNQPYFFVIESSVAYIAVFGGDNLVTASVSNPASMSVLGSGTHADMDGPVSVALKGSDAYVVCQNSGAIVSFDVSNLASPTAYGSLVISTNPSGAFGVTIVGDYALCTLPGDDEIAVVDISDPSNMTLASTFDCAAAGLSDPQQIKADGNIVFLASPGGNAIGVLGAHDLPTLKLLDTQPTGAATGPRALSLNGTYLAVAERDGEAVKTVQVYGTPVALQAQVGYSVGNGIVMNTMLEGDGQVLDGIAISDPQWVMRNNEGLRNSSIVGDFSQNTGTETTTIAAINTPVKANVTTTASPFNERFTHANNRLTYTGLYNATVSIFIHATIASGSANQTIQFFAYKNGVQITESRGLADLVDANDRLPITAVGITDIKTGDYLEIWVENTTGAANVELTNTSMSIIQSS